jgi:hypothetical protein
MRLDLTVATFDFTVDSLANQLTVHPKASAVRKSRGAERASRSVAANKDLVALAG